MNGLLMGEQMNSVTSKKIGLDLLREPFPIHQISKLPKPTKNQTEEVKLDFKKGMRCVLCGGWHHKDVVHLDYVGHAAMTDRLLDADQFWTWEPLSIKDGLPQFDSTGGLWIKLTVCGHTRLGYGNAESSNNKDAGSREKEVIGDALRNAAMRFGVALDLWHKGDLHKEAVVEILESQIKAVKERQDGPRNESMGAKGAIFVHGKDANPGKGKRGVKAEAGDCTSNEHQAPEANPATKEEDSAFDIIKEMNPITTIEYGQILALAETKNISKDALDNRVKVRWGVADTSKINRSQFDEIMKSLHSMKKNK